MRKLDRSSVPVPACLQNVPAGRRFGHLGRPEKNEIRDALQAIQVARCAYCERRTATDSGDGHIEHFRCQADHPHLDLDWSNLFWSCNDETTCGKFKDGCVRAGGPRVKFDPDDLIDPATEEPDDFLLFVTDGSVQVRDGLGDDAASRARETLRVFNLAHSAYLRKAREDAVQPYVKTVRWMVENAPQHLQAYVASELPGIANVPFSAVVRHFFRDFF